MEQVNHKSDFILEETRPENGWVVPFKFTYFTNVNRKTITVRFDGQDFSNNCTLLENGNLGVFFDNHNLGTGQLYVQRELFIPDANFKDGVRNDVRLEKTSVVIIKGVSQTSKVVNNYIPPYIYGKFDYAELTEEQLQDLANRMSLPVSDFINGGTVNMESDTYDIDRIAATLTGEQSTALAVIVGNKGLLSSQTRFNVSPQFLRRDKYFLKEDPFGVNVGDIIMITKYLGITVLTLLPVQDAKTADGSYLPTSGTVSGHDKARINKIDGIEWTANDTRNWLNSIANADLYKSKYGWGNNADSCLKTGVNPYFSDTIAGLTANWTLFVTCSSDSDSGGYYHLLQKAVCRDGDNLGRIFQRFGYYKGNGEDLHFTDWREG